MYILCVCMYFGLQCGVSTAAVYSIVLSSSNSRVPPSMLYLIISQTNCLPMFTASVQAVCLFFCVCGHNLVHCACEYLVIELSMHVFQLLFLFTGCPQTQVVKALADETSGCTGVCVWNTSYMYVTSFSLVPRLSPCSVVLYARASLKVNILRYEGRVRERD